MRRPSFLLLSLAAAAALTASFVPAIAAPPPTLAAYEQPALQDLSANIRVISKNDRELRKIGKDYPRAYSMDAQQIMCKEPGRVRFQGKKGILTFRTITNGTRKLTEASGLPLLGQKKAEDISKKPGKGDTIADLGIITPSWVDKVRSQWDRTEKRDGKTLQVYTGWYKGDRGARHEWAVDPATKTIVEHIHFTRNKKEPGIRKRLVYSDVKQIGGIWVPTRVTLYSQDNQQASVMQYDGIKINSGLPDRLFDF